MIDALGFIYDVIKDMKEYLTWSEEEKMIELSWVEKSGFDKEATKNGYALRWSRPDKVETRKLEGYDIMYELDKKNRVRRKLVTRDGLVLVGKKA